MRKGMPSAALVALAGSAVILPAVAGSEASPTVTAVNSTGIYAEQVHSWSPSQAMVGEGGSVTFSNLTTVPHGVDWISSPATPVCGGGVPVGTSEAASGTGWSGSCTFTAPGTYTFYCTVHKAAMSGTITVSAAAVAESQPTTTSPSTPVGSTGSGAGGGSSQPGTTNGGGSSGLDSSPFAGGASKALRLAPAQRGDAVRGSLAVSAAGAGGSLEVDVLAKAASLAGVRHVASVRVGKLERGSLAAGTVRFRVPLSAHARRTLTRRGRLALAVEITLRPIGGGAAKIERRVVLRPRL
jgi:plastocyanin